jgi:hypothetical protein
MDVDAALQTQIRNIETTYGKPLDHWFAVIDASGLTKHNEVVAMLKLTTGSRTAPRTASHCSPGNATPAQPPCRRTRPTLSTPAPKPSSGRCTMPSLERSVRSAPSTSPRKRAT